MQPSLLRSAERHIVYKDIADLDSAAIAGLVTEREVETLARAGHVEQLEILERRCGVATLQRFPEVGAFAEIAERRNLFAHTGGRVSAHYVRQCEKHKVVVECEPGDFLGADADYLRCSCEVLATVAVLLTQTLWRAVGGAAQTGAADRDLSQITYVLLVREEWALARRLLRFALSLPKHSSTHHTLVFRVNLAQAYKWEGNQAACDGILGAVEWDSVDVPFRLAEAVLRDEHDVAAELMETAGRSQRISRAAFDNWPLFRSFRNTTEYAQAYLALFGAAPPSFTLDVDRLTFALRDGARDATAPSRRQPIAAGHLRLTPDVTGGPVPSRRPARSPAVRQP